MLTAYVFDCRGTVCHGFFFMATITNITGQIRKKDRVNLFLDGEYAFSLSLFNAAWLRIGQELTVEKIVALKLEDEYERGKEIALRLIMNRPRSKKEVNDRMREKEIGEVTRDRVIIRFEELDLLDDEAFARYWIDQRARFKPRGKPLLRQELRQKGVDQQIVNDLLEHTNDSAAAMQAAEKKARTLLRYPEDQFKKKLTGFLQRRGFSYSEIREVVDQLWQQASETAKET
ncbi:MAG: regulatory protein [Cellvibrionaceae bacterium]|jgi:regulatory protein